jgi:hypothetical protein
VLQDAGYSANGGVQVGLNGAGFFILYLAVWGLCIPAPSADIRCNCTARACQQLKQLGTGSSIPQNCHQSCKQSTNAIIISSHMALELPLNQPICMSCRA